MKKLNKAVAMILTMAMVCSFASAVLAEETVEQVVVVEAPAPVQPEAPVVSEPAAEPASVETPAETTVVPETTAAPEATAVPEETVTPEATVAPEDTAAPTEEIAPEALPTEESAIDLSNVSITVKCLNGSSAKLGDTITLSAEVSGLDGVAYTMQWQYLVGGEWHDQSGANSSTCQFTLTEENAGYAWRLALTIA